MYRSFLVPLDGSQLAARAVPLAEKLAARALGRLILMQAATARGYAASDPAVQRIAVRSAEQYLGAVAAHLDEAPRVEQAVFYGAPAEGILEEIQLRGADLVVMSTHGRGGLTRFLLGSVADEVFRHAPVPVLLVPAACERTWEGDRPLRILATLDGSTFAREALTAVVELARIGPVDLRLVQVVEAVPELGPVVNARSVTSEAALAAARSALQREAASMAGVTHVVSSHALMGHPAEEIAFLAAALEADLIVMATHGRGGVSRAVAGSVAASTLQRAHTPLLLLRPYGVRVAAVDTVGTARRLGAPLAVGA
jgi:nucleotide-binding universal stress UspA family protein